MKAHILSAGELGETVAQRIMGVYKGHGLGADKPSPTLAELVESISHIKASADEWRAVAAYLGAQLHTARWHGDANVTREAMWALSTVWRALGKFEESVPAAGKHLESWSRPRIAERFADVEDPALFPVEESA